MHSAIAGARAWRDQLSVDAHATVHCIAYALQRLQSVHSATYGALEEVPCECFGV